MRDSQGVTYLHPDHLGSTMCTSGATASSQRYLPYGGQRGTAEVATDRRYTGQRWQAQFGLYDYNARWYDPELRRFVQPDTIVPEPGNPQSLNRYAYVLNNPVRYTDPSGNWIPETVDADDEQVLVAPGFGRIGVVFDSSYASELRKQTLHRTAEILRGRVTTDAQVALRGRGLTAGEAMMTTVYQGVRLSRSSTPVFIEAVNPILSGHIMNWRESLRRQNIVAETSPYYTDYLGSLGFRDRYRDPDPANPQVHHFWFYLQIAYERGQLLANLGNLRHETRDPGASWPDFALANAGARLGSNLRRGMSPRQAAGWLELYVLTPGVMR